MRRQQSDPSAIEHAAPGRATPAPGRANSCPLPAIRREGTAPVPAVQVPASAAEFRP